MAKVMVEVKQVDLKTFRQMFGIPEHTVQRWVHTKNFPAYKLGQKWYVDVKAFEKWRETEHANSYKYA
jgi:excisionase family DNA binding protein